MSLSIQSFCKTFRKRTLNKTLRDIELEQGINIKTLSAFENGRSNNIEHLSIYLNACETDYHVNLFMKGLNIALLDNTNLDYKVEG